jgi:type II secretory pathway pseudopilin PulG
MLYFNLRLNRGITLVELIVSIGLMALIFSTMAYMVFATGRNSLLVREQAISQNQAGAASERIATMLRNARFLKGYGADDVSTTLSRLAFEIPDPSATGGIRTGIVAFVPASGPNVSDGTIKIFEDSSEYSPGTLAATPGDWNFSNIHNFEVYFHSASWITVSISYTYRGFSLTTTDKNGDGVYDDLLAGDLVTDIIAKNHHPGESAHYAKTTNTLIQL